MHIMYMKAFTDAEKEKIKNLWSKLYGMGSYEHGIHSSEPRSSSNGAFASGSIAHVRGYLMKYISKSLHSESMACSELLFNALIKKHNIRLWGCSRRFLRIMKRPEEPLPDGWECVEVRQYCDEEFVGVYWIKDGGLRPSTIAIWKPVFSQSWSIADRRLLSSEFRQVFDKKTQLFTLFERVFVPVGVV